ncbi:MAG: ribosome biogenesis GTP-binding protein YihA/YsxC [Sneathiellaceae bacterium]
MPDAPPPDPAGPAPAKGTALDDGAPYDAAGLERGRKLFAGGCDFIAGIVPGADFPPPDLAEIAFAGRSNVGKSSLMNALTGRRALARVSNTPGRTQQLNFFRLGEAGRPGLSLVDLPGYGYAKAPKRDIARWTALTQDYLKGRVGLRRVCLLVDARHGLKDGDIAIMELLDEAAVIYQVVLTKADKLKSGELANVQAAVAKALARRVAAHPRLVVTSAETGTGIAELRAELAELTQS